MLLENKVAVIYGGGGAIGGAVARAFAREGARVFLAGRTRAKLDVVADDIRSRGGQADTAGAALGDVALSIEHVGSTSVPGLPAKPIIDIDLTVPDSRDEDAYRPALEAAGFLVLFREPVFHEHRFARSDSPPANIHIWSPDCPEAIRHRMLRDWLIAHPEEREQYAAAKFASAEQINAEGGRVMDYNQRKQPVIRDILERMFRAHGLID